MDRYKFLCAVGAAAAIYLLSLTGENEPEWLAYAVVTLFIGAIIFAAVGIVDTTDLSNDGVNAANDEHRDHAI